VFFRVTLEAKMATICDTSKDEDEIADVGNDLIEVRLLLGPVNTNFDKICAYGNHKIAV
jgi:hypothetical protein